MKISYNWLKEYVNTDLSVDRASEILTSIGLEVEGIEKVESIKGGLEGMVVGLVVSCQKHPNADSLSVTEVDYGQGLKTIVCGAPNVAQGKKVVVATVGATLYPNPEEPFKIKKSKIRGVESLGMLCAEDELGIGTSHDGIILLDDSAVVGTPAKEIFNLQEDYILEIGLTPNHSDAASHYGVARDFYAYLKVNKLAGELSRPSVDSFAVENRSLPVEVIVEDAARCPRYMGVTLSGVTVAPSPEWLQKSLRTIGLTPRNNVVDITNFILHAFGQPLHAFDADKIVGGKVVVRTASQGEKFTTLDEIERELSSEDLMICNSTEPMCIAGVMGGLKSGINEDTTNVFIESAYFNPVTVRKSAKRHTISSDASFRYERGTDPNILPYALQLAAIMVRDIAGGVISSEIVSVGQEVFEPFEVELSIDRAERLIGKKLGREIIENIVTALGIELVQAQEDVLTLRVPQYRVDVQRDVDVVEEILRIYGYNNVELPQSLRSTIGFIKKPDIDSVVNRMSNILTSNGFNEIMCNSLTSSNHYESLKHHSLETCVKIANPLSQELNVMRQTLLFGALESVVYNVNRKNSNIKFYEQGNCYFFDGEKQCENPLKKYSERYTFALTVSGDDTISSWNSQQSASSIYTLRAWCELLFSSFGLTLNQAKYVPTQNDIFEEGMEISLKNRSVLKYGTVSKKISKRMGLKNTQYYAEIDLENFLWLVSTVKNEVSELSKYPEVKRDLALLVDSSITFNQLYAVAVKTEKNILKSVSLFDVYQGEKLPEGKKSYALNFVLEDTTKTLTDNVIDKCINNLIRQFEKELGAEIRK